jgi:hypothetical protein
MKFSVGVLVFSIVLGTIYGVLFNIYYPLVSMDAGIVLLCGVLGLATTLIVMGLWKAIRKK